MRCAAALVALATLAFAHAARANGRLPAANQLVFAPDDPSSMTLRTTFGMLFTSDAGKTWDWLCEDAIPMSGQQDPAITLLNGGVVISAQQEGLATSPDRGCSWSFVAGTAKNLAVDVARTTDGESAVAIMNVYQATNDAGTLLYQSNVLHTSDAAKTWQSLSGAIDPTLVIDTIDLAPSDPQRIYVTGETYGAPNGTMLVSSDGGQTYTPYTIPFVSNELGAYIAAVDPTNEDLVYVRTLGRLPTNETVSRLLVSSDGGQTYGAYWSGDAMLGFALSPDGSRVYIGNIADGLFAANASDLNFTQLSPLQVQCLAMRDTTLYVCSNETSSVAQTGSSFVLATTIDEGQSFTPLLALETIAGPIACAAGTSAAICANEWPTLAYQLHDDAGTESASDASADAAPPSSNCGCETSDPKSGAIFAGLAFALYLVRRLILRSRLSRAAR